MTKRIEQSRRRGHYDPRWTDRLHLVTGNEPTVPNEPEVPVDAPVPHLALVAESAIAAMPFVQTNGSAPTIVS